jgi:hypothetical protein
MLYALKFLKAMAPQLMSYSITLVLTIVACVTSHSARYPITTIVSIKTNSCLTLPTMMRHCSVEPSISTNSYPSTKYILLMERV